MISNGKHRLMIAAAFAY